MFTARPAADNRSPVVLNASEWSSNYCPQSPSDAPSSEERRSAHRFRRPRRAPIMNFVAVSLSVTLGMFVRSTLRLQLWPIWYFAKIYSAYWVASSDRYRDFDSRFPFIGTSR